MSDARTRLATRSPFRVLLLFPLPAPLRLPIEGWCTDGQHRQDAATDSRQSSWLNKASVINVFIQDRGLLYTSCSNVQSRSLAITLSPPVLKSDLQRNGSTCNRHHMATLSHTFTASHSSAPCDRPPLNVAFSGTNNLHTFKLQLLLQLPESDHVRSQKTL
uniref:Uncharacterized protein n=1 Tax=Physcomitrium patens TaxID=3218 RepID=A0A2K1IXN2_PHYPA|nr:hypothetical protein PHYPA_023856 [Physcomitrium patens]